jgi:hypothetical protein
VSVQAATPRCMGRNRRNMRRTRLGVAAAVSPHTPACARAPPSYGRVSHPADARHGALGGAQHSTVNSRRNILLKFGISERAPPPAPRAARRGCDAGAHGVAAATGGINGGLVVLLLQLTAGRTAAATGAAAANQHAQSLRRSKVCAVSAAQPSAIKGSQGFPKGCCVKAERNR